MRYKYLMGATTFTVTSKGATAREAFDRAREKAEYDHGHRGYTGTIAEKSRFIEIARVEGEAPMKTANRLLDADDERISEKCGPAGCIDLGDGSFLFFGWAMC